MGEKKVIRYPVIIEKAQGNFSAYSPDLPGCVATGSTADETLIRMKEAIQFHIEGLKREGSAIPESSTEIQYVEVTI
jgi:predicted RNase H-like HicB family nuclease